MKNRNFPWAIIAAAAVAGVGFAGVTNIVRNNSKKSPDVTQVSGQDGNVSITTDSLSGDGNRTNEGNKSDNSETGNDRSNVNQVSKVDSLNRAIKANKYDVKGIRVLDVTVEDGNAIVDMNGQVRYNWGSEEEADFLNVMKDSLSRFESIKTFQIRVDGEILKSLGHFEVDPVKVR